MKFDFTPLEIPGAFLVGHERFGDERGAFMETYRYSEFAANGITEQFAQDNHSVSSKNVLRGLHYQKHPRAQGKLVRCVRGAIFDVCVDLRTGSPAYRRWVGKELTETNNLMLYVPPGCAHGFYTLSEAAGVVYKCTSEYDRDLDSGILWSDPEIGVAWPAGAPILSEKDKTNPLLRDAATGF